MSNKFKNDNVTLLI